MSGAGSHSNAVWAKRIKSARLAAGLSQKELGVQAGLDPFVASTRINRYEQGVHKADYLISVRISAVLDVPTAYLYCEDDTLAEALLLLHQLTPARLKKALKLLRAVSEDVG